MRGSPLLSASRGRARGTPYDELKGQVDELSKKLGVQITLQREEVFRFMYRL